MVEGAWYEKTGCPLAVISSVFSGGVRGQVEKSEVQKQETSISPEYSGNNATPTQLQQHNLISGFSLAHMQTRIGSQKCWQPDARPPCNHTHVRKINLEKSADKHLQAC